MGMPAAKQGDQVLAVDIHLTIVPTPAGPVQVPLPYPFNGILNGGLSTNVKINGRPAATVNSTATNTPPHIPLGTGFAQPPSNQARIILGSFRVFINRKPAARMGDRAMTCNSPTDLPVGTVVAASNVLIG